MTSHPCCDHDRLCSEAAELDELAADPTLAACCQRDAQEQAVAARLRAQLTLVDRSRQREALRAAVFGAAAEEEDGASVDSLESSGDDDEQLGEPHDSVH